jgi:hypothetical protein
MGSEAGVFGESQSLLEREIDELFKQAIAGANRGKRIAATRRIFAYLFKIVAAGSGLVVGFNLFPGANQYFGIAAAVAVFLDSITQNFKRLQAEAKAGYAFFFLKEKVHRTFNRDLGLLQAKADADGTSRSAPQVKQQELEFQRLAQAELQKGVADIRQFLADEDLKSLEALSLDAERAAAKLPPA